MKTVIDNINKWTVGGITTFYQTLVANTYFIIANLFGLTTLFFFETTMNNLVFFILPIFLLMQSILIQFHILPDLEEYSMRRFIKIYPLILKQNWRLLVIATAVILMIIIDVSILMHITSSQFLITAVIITAIFLINSLLFVFLIESDKKAKKIPLHKKFLSGLILSYRLPLITLKNAFLIGLSIFSIQFIPVYYVVFIGGISNLLIWKNLQKRFSLDLFFEQIAAQGNFG